MVPFPSIKSVYMNIVMQNDLEKSVNFYKDILEIACSFYVPNQWAEFRIGQVRIGLCQSEKTIDNFSEAHHTGIVFEVDNCEETYAVLQSRGVEFISTPTKSEHGIMVTFLDPSKNCIDLYQPTNSEQKAQIDAELSGCCSSDKSSCC